MKYKYTVEFETEEELEGYGIDIVEPSVERGLIKADKNGVASWWYQSPSYAIEWKILKKQMTKNCGICRTPFKVREDAKHGETRQLCLACRKANRELINKIDQEKIK